MKHLLPVLLGVFGLSPIAEAQNSSLLHAYPVQSVTPTPHRFSGLNVATTQAQARFPELLPAPNPESMSGSVPRSIPGAIPGAMPGAIPRSDPSMNPAPGNVMPPEYMPPVLPPMASHAPRQMPDINPAVGLQGVSWTYQPAPPLRQFRVQDPVTIRVDEISRTMNQGNAVKRRNSIFLAVLSDWVKLTRGGIIPDPQEDGSPTIASQSQSNFQAQTSIEARESVSFNITARIVDIRPNGNLVLEARKTYRHNDNLWETSLSGICRAQDIGPDNVVLSRDLIDLEIHKEDQGYVRDGYKRGWFTKLFDGVKPF